MRSTPLHPDVAFGIMFLCICLGLSGCRYGCHREQLERERLRLEFLEIEQLQADVEQEKTT